MTTEKGNILVVDDDQAVLYTAKMILKQHYSNIDTVSNPATASEFFMKNEYDVVLLDMNFKSGATNGKEGIELLKKMVHKKPDVYIITNTAYGDIDLAVQAMKLGAKDYIVKPWQKEKLLTSVSNAMELKRSKLELEKSKTRASLLAKDLEQASGNLLWKDTAMKPVIQFIDKVAATSANVLILGENGTGKELVARAIHRQSERAKGPFIKVDLGTISETLFESELFGHAKGAFTDAREEKSGRFEIANGGTVFLDEIGNLTLNMQAKLLTVIQSKQIHRVGSSTKIDLDIRWICATNKDLYHAVDEGDFRQDLLYRINTVEITVPPLRQREKDIPFLIIHFLNQFSSKYKKPGLVIGEKELSKLIAYPWPGNVRELQHAVERAVILSEASTLEATDFVAKSNQNDSGTKKSESLDIRSVEKIAIMNALDKTQGNLSNAAKELGMGRTTLYRKMKKYNLQP
jgi:DNA-binding NtrC family response regulator